MKKRCISLILLLALLLTCLPVQAGAAEDVRITVAEPVRINAGQPARRSPIYEIGSTSTIVGAPNMRDFAIANQRAEKAEFILRDSGAPGLYYCVDIYQGTSVYGEKLASVSDAFPGVQGLYYLQLEMWVEDFPVGSYLFVLYTSKTAGGAPVSGTQSQFTMQKYSSPLHLRNTTLSSATTGEQLSFVGMALGETEPLVLNYNPSNTTWSRHELEVSGGNGTLILENCGGLIFAHAVALGWGTIVLNRYGVIYMEVPVEVCINPEGHINSEVTVLHEESGGSIGVWVEYCPDCGAARIETEAPYSAYFDKFVDVPEGSWYYDAVKDAVYQGLFFGVSEHHFNPADTMTRAMLVTVLWRFAGEPDEGDNTFTDVKDSQWYADAVRWAANRGIVAGVGNGRFDPNGKVTREQMAAILYRFAKEYGLDPANEPGALQNFPDVARVSSYAVEPLEWAVSQGIISGTKEGGQVLIHPKGSATRAQVASLLTRFIEKYYPEPEPVLPDTAAAIDSGTYEHYFTWAYHADGTLEIGGTYMPNFQQYPYTQDDRPWLPYLDQITRLVILEGMGNISTGAFEGCTALEEVLLPQSLVHIGASAFQGCSSLKAIELPDGLKELDGQAFAGCTSLEEVRLPDSLYYLKYRTYTADGLFEDCTSLKKVTLPLGWLELPENIFRNCTALTTVILPESLQNIHAGAFENCTSLTELVLPFGVRRIEDESFNGCTALERLYIPHPLASVYTLNTTTDGEDDSIEIPVYTKPFGEVEVTTVYAFSGTQIESLAKEFGYNFVPLEDIVE